jgi:type II secretory pathway pseudopilin PulG
MNPAGIPKDTLRQHGATRAFTRTEALVVLVIVVVLVVAAFPVYSWVRQRQHKQVALQKMKDLGGALTAYTSQSGGLLPEEDAPGGDSWAVIASPAAKDAWYNALPKAIGRKGAGEFNPESFYSDENLVFLPGANYPDKKKSADPMFAIAYNTKLQRKDPQGKKERLKMNQIVDPGRTVALLEQGVMNESRTNSVQTKSDYDGSPKGSAKSFVGRYGGEGVLCFIDGHVQLIKASDVLTPTGSIPFPPADLVWTANPADNPNKDSSSNNNASSKKKSKKAQ